MLNIQQIKNSSSIIRDGMTSLCLNHFIHSTRSQCRFDHISNCLTGIYIRDKFSFIPTPSSLDIGKGNINLNDNDYKLAYVGATPPVAPKNSSFANFSTDFDKVNPNTSNKTHISFNSRNGEWLAKELNINPITRKTIKMPIGR